MRSRSGRLFFVAVAWIVIGAAAFYIFSSEKTVRAAAERRRSVDQYAREAADALGDVRLAQQAYVASGQGVAFWTPKVADRTAAFNAALTAFRRVATEAVSVSALDEAGAAMREFVDVDRRARDYLRVGQSLMAADVIFSESNQLAAVAAQQVQTAKQAEHQAFDASEAATRRAQAFAAGAGGLLTALIVFGLAMAGGRSSVTDTTPASGSEALSYSLRQTDEGVVSHARPAAAPARSAQQPENPPVSQAAKRNATMLKAAADLATDFGRVRDSAELERLMARASDLMDAAGLVVWLSDGHDGLRPVLTHGYGPQMLARMQSLPRNADNAAASAFRTGDLQIVLSRPGGASGAIVAPILGGDGCVGALSAEIQGGGEGSEAVQAIAAIVAAHLASVLSFTPAEAETPAKAAQA